MLTAGAPADQRRIDGAECTKTLVGVRQNGVTRFSHNLDATPNAAAAKRQQRQAAAQRGASFLRAGGDVIVSEADVKNSHTNPHSRGRKGVLEIYNFRKHGPDKRDAHEEEEE